MSDELFVQSPGNSPAAGTPHGTHKAFSILDADDPSAYKFGYTQGRMQGTLVPVSSEHGGIKGSKNHYGKVVTGRTISGDGHNEESKPFVPGWIDPTNTNKPSSEDIGPNDLLEDVGVSPRPLLDLAPEGEGIDVAADKLAADQRVEDMQTARSEEFKSQLVRQREAELELQHILAEASEPMSGQEDRGEPISPLSQDTIQKALAAIRSPASVASELVQVTLRGTFGSYRGFYSQVYATTELVVLVYDINAPIYSPPPGMDTFHISWQEQQESVYFAGIEFELPFADCGVQVMVKSKEG